MFAIMRGQTAHVGSNKELSYTPSFGVYALCENYDGNTHDSIHRLDNTELATVLAALRFWQRVGLS